MEPTELIKRCNNQADKGPRKVRKALERLHLPSELTKRCHNQANIGLRKMESLSVQQELAQAFSKGFERPSPTGASLACQEPPLVAPDRQG